MEQKTGTARHGQRVPLIGTTRCLAPRGSTGYLGVRLSAQLEPGLLLVGDQPAMIPPDRPWPELALYLGDEPCGPVRRSGSDQHARKSPRHGERLLYGEIAKYGFLFFKYSAFLVSLILRVGVVGQFIVQRHLLNPRLEGSCLRTPMGQIQHL
jgi:hypothetical protein